MYLKSKDPIKVKYWTGVKSSVDKMSMMKAIHESAVQENETTKLYRTKFKEIMKHTPEEIFELLFKSDQSLSGRLEKGMVRLDVVAQQIKLALNAIEGHKGDSNNKFKETMDKIITWLNSMGEIYDGMDSEIATMLEKLSSFKFQEKIKATSNKVEAIINK